MTLLTMREQSALQPPLRSLITLAADHESFVVQGGPGTGKTLFALHRALSAASAVGARSLLLVSSDLLATHLRSIVAHEGDPGVEVLTWRAWLATELRRHGERAVPKRRGADHLPDWEAIEARWAAWFSDAGTRYRSIAIDEAQDVPRQLMRLARRASISLSLFCDPYQRFEQHGSDLVQMVEALEVQRPWPVFLLEEDFRTTREIQAFAHTMFAPERGVPKYRPAAARGEEPRVVVTEPGGALDALVAGVQRLAKRDDIASVGVLTTHATRAKVQAALREGGIEDAGSGALPEASGEKGTALVRVLAVGTVRGLEFDAVVLAGVPADDPQARAIGERRDLYVGATRARKLLSVVLDETIVPDYLAGVLRSSSATPVEGGRA